VSGCEVARTLRSRSPLKALQRSRHYMWCRYVSDADAADPRLVGELRLLRPDRDAGRRFVHAPRCGPAEETPRPAVGVTDRLGSRGRGLRELIAYRRHVVWL